MKIKSFFFRYTGIMATLIYLTFALISYRLYPKPFSPLMNWLSDLGNPLDNPSGAFFYNLGCIAISLILVVFYIGMSQWRATERKIKIPLIIAQSAGIFSSLSLLIAAIFPLGAHTSIHSFWSMMLFIGFAFFESFSAVAFIMHPHMKKWVGCFGYLASLVNLITIGFFNLFIGEWTTITMFIIYITIITFQYNRLASGSVIQKNCNEIARSLGETK